jgi:hypothetical protein
MSNSEISENTITENHIVTQTGFHSLPLRMPGMTLNITCTTPVFQLILKGGYDDTAIFEMNQETHLWKITPLNFALGRMVQDIVWEDNISEKTIINVLYATVCKLDSFPSPLLLPSQSQSLESRQYTIEIDPKCWVMLPKSKHCVSHIQINEPINVVFRLAIGTIPLKILPDKSENNILNISHNELVFSQLLGAWLVFDTVPMDTCQPLFKIKITYFISSSKFS